MVTVCPNNDAETLTLNPTDPDDFLNANVFVKNTLGVIEGLPVSNLQTIVEVVNPLLSGDGTATEIAVGRTNDASLSLPYDETDDGVVYRREMSLNDKMKNVLKELKENEKVRLSLSRSMDEEEEEEEVSASYEEKQGSIGTVFMVRERLINDFYDHESPDSATHNFPSETVELAEESHATVYANPSVDEFLANEIRHAQAEVAARKETLTLDLSEAAVADEMENDDEDEDATTPTTPTKSLGANGAGGKKKRKKNKNKKK